MKLCTLSRKRVGPRRQHTHRWLVVRFVELADATARAPSASTSRLPGTCTPWLSLTMRSWSARSRLQSIISRDTPAQDSRQPRSRLREQRRSTPPAPMSQPMCSLQLHRHRARGRRTPPARHTRRARTSAPAVGRLVETGDDVHGLSGQVPRVGCEMRTEATSHYTCTWDLTRFTPSGVR